jgi:hypothetical protein
MLLTAPRLPFGFATLNPNTLHLIIPPNNKVGRKPSWLAANLVCPAAMPRKAALDVRQYVTLPIRHTSATFIANLHH